MKVCKLTPEAKKYVDANYIDTGSMGKNYKTVKAAMLSSIDIDQQNGNCNGRYYWRGLDVLELMSKS